MRTNALALAVGVMLLIASTSCGRHEGAGEIRAARVPAAALNKRSRTRAQAARNVGIKAGAAKQILFGDLHVHTTFSADAFALSLPIMQGEGAHPPADACDFARYCSALDFWSINDHAEALTPEHWRETKQAVRQCNAVAGDSSNPDLVTFLGWEWSQVGETPQTHFGHKNVILLDTDEEHVPARPIAAPPRLMAAFTQKRPLWQRLAVPLLDWPNRQRYLDFMQFQNELRATALCPQGVDTRRLPADCHEVAETPAELFEKLSQWGFDTIVIPHGTTWGLYTPPGTSIDKQLNRRQHDPDKQILFEIYSGHGNSEEYRGWTATRLGPGGELACPEPTTDYLPCCWQAGEIIRARCGELPREQCEQRVEEARRFYAEAGQYGHLTVPGASVEDWKDCGQCRDCFLPAFNFRPRNSAQYALAITNFEEAAEPLRFHFGFIGSSDNHKARPGTGYKEYDRLQMTEATGPRSEAWRSRIAGPDVAPAARSLPRGQALANVSAIRLWEGERQASFFMTGGLVAVHSAGRSREAIWAALKRREVYATSGERILLWFDLDNAAPGPTPMGSQVRLARNPVFRVRAAGALKQLPGCPELSARALGTDRLQKLCRGECYNPSDERRKILRIEVVRIRPQQSPGEDIGNLIEDPWKTLPCPPAPDGCVVRFEDPDFERSRREVIYYVRAIQEATPAINAAGLRCRYNEAGVCVEEKPCYGDYRTPAQDDCLAPTEERAWSSPIYVEPMDVSLQGR